MEFKLHPLAEVFPHSPELVESLRDSIRRHGLNVPISVLPDGQVVDGRHRLEAMQALGIDLVEGEHYRLLPELKTPTDLRRYVWDANGNRRSLTEAQEFVAFRALYPRLGRGKRQYEGIAPTRKGQARNLPVEGKATGRAAA